MGAGAMPFIAGAAQDLRGGSRGGVAYQGWGVASRCREQGFKLIGNLLSAPSVESAEVCAASAGAKRLDETAFLPVRLLVIGCVRCR